MRHQDEKGRHKDRKPHHTASTFRLLSYCNQVHYLPGGLFWGCFQGVRNSKSMEEVPAVLASFQTQPNTTKQRLCLVLLCSQLRAGPPVGQRAYATGIKGSTWVRSFSAHQTPLSQIQYAPPVQAIAPWQAGPGGLAAGSVRGRELLGPPPTRCRRAPAPAAWATAACSPQPSQPRPARACPELGSAESADATERLPGESCRQVFSW